ncbi:MAG: tetratricopeptide repeat protein [Brevinema sp.]
MTTIFIVFFSLMMPIFAQDLPPEDIVTLPKSNELEETILPEFGELKLKLLLSDLSLEELYRLASFYLSEQLYLQAAELYGQFLEKDIPSPRIAVAHYNRALSLFSLALYESALPEFLNAYHYNKTLYDALRMVGTIYFLQKNKEKSLEIWQEYLEKNTEDSPNKVAIEKAVQLLSDPAFQFPEEQKTPNTQKTWPFLNPEIIPNPDAEYQKKRVI